VPITGAVAFNVQIEALGEVHEMLTSLLLLLVLGHAVMAIYHQVVLKDGVMARMR
jgi:cytochrome b561